MRGTDAQNALRDRREFAVWRALFGAHMIDMDFTNQFLGDSMVSIVGAGSMGRAIARGLLKAGFRRDRLAICTRGSEKSRQDLENDGLLELAADGNQALPLSKIALYLVRPQDYRAIGEYSLRRDCLLISFLAGVSIGSLPVEVPESLRARVMPSAPDTLEQKNGIAALYPGENPVALELLRSLHMKVFPLADEDAFHAFTAFGPVLPIALTHWESLGRTVDDAELLAAAAVHGLTDYATILAWARSVQPGRLAPEAHRRYLAQAATPGGVTQAALTAIDEGQELSRALEQGLRRCRELAGA